MPAAGTRMPNEYKKVFKATYKGGFARDYLKEVVTHKKKVAQMGENFQRKFPMIYKKGVFNRAR